MRANFSYLTHGIWLAYLGFAAYYFHNWSIFLGAVAVVAWWVAIFLYVWWKMRGQILTKEEKKTSVALTWSDYAVLVLVPLLLLTASVSFIPPPIIAEEDRSVIAVVERRGSDPQVYWSDEVTLIVPLPGLTKVTWYPVKQRTDLMAIGETADGYAVSAYMRADLELTPDKSRVVAIHQRYGSAEKHSDAINQALQEQFSELIGRYTAATLPYRLALENLIGTEVGVEDLGVHWSDKLAIEDIHCYLAGQEDGCYEGR